MTRHRIVNRAFRIAGATLRQAREPRGLVEACLGETIRRLIDAFEDQHPLSKLPDTSELRLDVAFTLDTGTRPASTLEALILAVDRVLTLEDYHRETGGHAAQVEALAALRDVTARMSLPTREWIAEQIRSPRTPEEIASAIIARILGPAP